MKALAIVAAVIMIPCISLGVDDLKGKITAINAAAGTIEVSGVKVNVNDALIKDVREKRCTLSDLKVGDSVDLDGLFTGPGEMTATKIEQEERVKDQIEGKISAVDTAERTLTISGVKVSAPIATTVKDKRDMPMPFENLKAGMRVECEGEWKAARHLKARKIEME